jgi:PAS domain S-box-containing protein
MNKEIQNIPASAPLLCWDIFMEGYHRRMEYAGDVQHLNKLSEQKKWQQSWNFEDELFRQHKTILVTDSSLHINYATSNIFAMNGYTPKDVIGKSPKMFQGKETSTDARAMIRRAITDYLPFETTILNYRKNGSPYHCHIKAYPVFNNKKSLVNFIAFENLV